MQDLRFAIRSLRRSPAFTLVVLATLALGVGVTTAVFSLVNGMLLSPLPYAEPERVMTLWEANPQLGIDQDRVSAGTYRDWTERTSAFSAMGAYSFETFILEGDRPEQLSGARVSPSVLEVVGVRPRLGRPFREEEAVPGNQFVALLSHGFWTRRFGEDPGVLGTVLTLDGQPYEVVGVMPPDFEFPPDADEVEIWTPLAIDERLYPVRAMRVYDVVGRLAPGSTEQRAREELAAVTRRVAEENPESNRGWTSDVTPALEQLVGEYRTLVAILAGASALVLLIGCVNIANLVLARATASQREFALRATLGASRRRLLGRSLAESLALVVGGGGLGAGLAVLGVSVLKRVLPPDLPRLDHVEVDPAVLAFAALASAFAGVFFGLYPALRAMRPRVIEVLQDAGRGGHGSRRAARLRNAMVSGQVALAMILLVAATAMARSFAGLLAVDPGFRTEDVTVVALSLPQNDFPDQASQRQFWNVLVDRVRAIPGVLSAGAVSALPMSPLGIDFDLPISIQGRGETSTAEQPRAEYRSVLPGYFEAMGMPLVKGRLLDRFDREEGRPVMVVNETAERLLFTGDEAVGQILGVPMAGQIEVVGVVGDVRHAGLDAPAAPELFVSYQNFALRDMHLVVHGADDGGELADAIRAEISAVAPALLVTRVTTMDELVSDSLAQPRFNTALLMAFAISALVLAAVGIYGVISYSVVQRTGEIGIRMALGSDAARTFRLVVGQTLRYVVGGGVAGVAGTLFVGPLLQGLLHEVEVLDPMSVGVVVAVLVVTATVAASVPARRATRIDPVVALTRG